MSFDYNRRHNGNRRQNEVIFDQTEVKFYLTEVNLTLSEVIAKTERSQGEVKNEDKTLSSPHHQHNKIIGDPSTNQNTILITPHDFGINGFNQ